MKIQTHLLSYLLFLIMGAVSVEACVLCKSLERARDRFAEAASLEAEATLNAGNGNTAKAAQQFRRALTLRANACYNIRSSTSKFGESLVQAKLASIWPDAPSADECDAIIDLNATTPGSGGGGGGGAPGGGGGAGGSVGGQSMPGPIDGSGARSGAPSVTGCPDETVTVTVTLVGIDPAVLPSVYTVGVTKEGGSANINLSGSASAVTPAALTEGGTQEVVFSFDIAPAALPGDFAIFTWSTTNNDTGKSEFAWSNSFAVVVKGDDGVDLDWADIEAIEVGSPDGVKTITDNTVPTTLDYTFTNTDPDPVRFWAVFTQPVDEASKKEYPESLSIFDIIDSRASMPTGLPATSPDFPATPTDIPNAIHVPIELGGAGSGSESTTMSIPLAGSEFCEKGMTVCCRLHLRSVNPSSNFDPPYNKWSEQFQQYVANLTPLETSVFSTSVGLVGKVDGTGGDAQIDVQGESFTVPIPPGATAAQAAEIIAVFINTSVQATNGLITTNVIPNRFGMEFSGLRPGEFQINLTPPGLTPVVPVEIVSLDLVSMNPIVVGSGGGFPTWDVPVTTEMIPLESIPATGAFLAQLQINGINWLPPQLVPFNGVDVPTQIQFNFTDVPMPFGHNFITVALDPIQTLLQQQPGSGFDFEFLDLFGDPDFLNIPIPGNPLVNLQAQPQQDFWLFHAQELGQEFTLATTLTTNSEGNANSAIDPQFTPDGKSFFTLQPSADVPVDLELETGQDRWLLLPYTLTSEEHPENLNGGQTLSFQVVSVTDGEGNPIPGISASANNPHVYGTRSSSPKESSEGIFQGVTAYVPVKVALGITAESDYQGPLNIGIQPFVGDQGGDPGFYHYTLNSIVSGP